MKGGVGKAKGTLGKSGENAQTPSPLSYHVLSLVQLDRNQQIPTISDNPNVLSDNQKLLEVTPRDCHSPQSVFETAAAAKRLKNSVFSLKKVSSTQFERVVVDQTSPQPVKVIQSLEYLAQHWHRVKLGVRGLACKGDLRCGKKCCPLGHCCLKGILHQQNRFASKLKTPLKLT